MIKISKISKQKGIDIIADCLFLGKKRKEIIQEFTEKYKVCESSIDKWIKEANKIVQERRSIEETEKTRLIKETTEDTVNKLNLGLEMILSEYKKIAFFDLRKVYNESNSLIDIKSFDDASAAAVSGIEVLEEFEGTGADRRHIGNTVKLKLSDKRAALDSICKVLGYAAPTQTELSGKVTLEQITGMVIT